MVSKKIDLNETKDQIRQILCNRCNIETNHLVCSSVKISWGNEDIQGHDVYEMVKCSGCDSVSFRIGSSNSEDYFYHDEINEVIYPETERIYPSRLMGRTALEDIYSLPDKVRLIYEETHLALCAKLKILAGVGIRSLVEAVCVEEKAKGSNLKIKIDDLVVKQVLTKRNADILHRTRFLGNRAAHEIESPTDAEIDVAFDIVENLLETVYIIPKKAELLKTEKIKSSLLGS